MGRAMSEGRRPEGIGPGTGRRGTRAPGKGPHPLLAAFAELGWRPSNGVAKWIGTLPRDMTVDDAIQRIPPTWEEALGGLGAALRTVRPMPWEKLRLLPAYAAHGTDPRGGA